MLTFKFIIRYHICFCMSRKKHLLKNQVMLSGLDINKNGGFYINPRDLKLFKPRRKTCKLVRFAYFFDTRRFF